MNKAYTTTGVKAVPVPLFDIARLFAIDELDEVIHLLHRLYLFFLHEKLKT